MHFAARFSELCSTVLKTEVQGQKTLASLREVVMNCIAHNPQIMKELPTVLVSMSVPDT